VIFLAFPVAMSAALAAVAGAIDGDLVVVVIAILSIAAAVLTGLIAVLQNIVGGIRIDAFLESERMLYRHTRSKLNVLRSLYADIAFTVLVLLIALVASGFLYADINHHINLACSGLIYYAAISLGLSLVHIISGVYLVLDVQANDLERRLRANAPRNSQSFTKNDDEPDPT
jgi:hypothetical protein